jgi:hypothetical protein
MTCVKAVVVRKLAKRFWTAQVRNFFSKYVEDTV